MLTCSKNMHKKKLQREVHTPRCIPSNVCCCPPFSAGLPFFYSTQQDVFRNPACLPDLQLCLSHQQRALACTRVGSDSKVHQETNTLPVSSSCSLRCRSVTVPVMFCAFFSSFCTDFEPVRTLASLVLPARSVFDCILVFVAGHMQHYGSLAIQCTGGKDSVHNTLLVLAQVELSRYIRWARMAFGSSMVSVKCKIRNSKSRPVCQ